MKRTSIGVIGGGVLGLTLAYRLGQRGHAVTLYEAGPTLGGLAGAHDYGPFVWDRFYHCILPTDSALVGLIGELGLGSELRWNRTGTGYFGQGTMHPMNGNADFLRFPLLSIADKARLGATVLYATRVADPWKLYQVSAAEWLTRLCGRRGYEIFWRPLLKAKFGPYHDQVAAVFIWATLTRLYGARSVGTAREKLGYVSGGYAAILGAFRRAFERHGVTVRAPAAVEHVAPDGDGGCTLETLEAGQRRRARFDQVFFTAPTRLARAVVARPLARVVEEAERDYPTAGAYLGVACLVLALKRRLTPYYVLNIGDERIELTGLIEMTNLIDPAVETAGLHLVYLPRYLDSADPRLDGSDGELADQLMDRGLRRLFPRLADSEVVYRGLHRARLVQPLPLVRAAGAPRERVPTLDSPLQILNTSMLTCATLNNNEVVALVDRFLAAEGAGLDRSRAGVASA